MRLFGRRRVEDRALSRQTLTPSMLPDPLTGQPILPDAAMRIADVFACVRCLADTAASLPLVAYRRTDRGRVRFDGRLAGLLARPAPGSTTANLVGTIVAHLNLHGNAFVAKYRDDRGVVEQLAPLNPTAVTVKLEAGEPRYTVLRTEGVSVHGADDLIHIRALSTDGLVGLSPVAQARQALGLSRALATHADAFARNAGRPGGILAVGGEPQTSLRDAQRPEGAPTTGARLKEQFGDLFTGERSGSVAVVSAGSLTYQQLALSMADAEFVAQRQLSTSEVARIFRVPPWMVGAPDGSSMTYSNVESQAQAFVTFSLAPWLALIEQALSADADLAPSRVYCEFLVDALLRADAQTRANVYSAALDPATGWMTRAEVRRRENLPAESPAPIPPQEPQP